MGPCLLSLFARIESIVQTCVFTDPWWGAQCHCLFSSAGTFGGRCHNDLQVTFSQLTNHSQVTRLRQKNHFRLGVLKNLRCVPPCVAKTCVVRPFFFAWVVGSCGWQIQELVRRGHENKCYFSGPAREVGHQRHAGLENQDGQHMLSQPRRFFLETFVLKIPNRPLHDQALCYKIDPPEEAQENKEKRIVETKSHALPNQWVIILKLLVLRQGLSKKLSHS